MYSKHEILCVTVLKKRECIPIYGMYRGTPEYWHAGGPVLLSTGRYASTHLLCQAPSYYASTVTRTAKKASNKAEAKQKKKKKKNKKKEQKTYREHTGQRQPPSYQVFL